MSGSGVEKRRNIDAIRAAKLAADGMTHRQIAATLGKDDKQIKNLIAKGQRLIQLERLPS